MGSKYRNNLYSVNRSNNISTEMCKIITVKLAKLGFVEKHPIYL
jgi:hypothetical protein